MPVMVSGTITDASGQNSFWTNNRSIFEFSLSCGFVEYWLKLCYGCKRNEAVP